MGVCLFANDAVASLASAVLTTDTALSLATGSGAVFPNPTGGDYFNAVIYNATQYEYVKCTTRAGDVLTVLRAQENTAALAFAAGDKVELRLTAATMGALAQTAGQGTAASRNVGEAPGEVPDGEFSVRTGMMSPFAGAAGAVPSDYLLCNGQAVSRTTYARLFAVIGTTYGTGDGSNTFNVPNMNNNMPVGAGGLYALGSAGGSATTNVSVGNHALSISELPAHGHTWSDAPHTHGVSDPGHAHGVYDPGHAHGVADPGHQHQYTALQAPFNGVNADVGSGSPPVGSQYSPETGVSATGISIYGANTGIGIYGATANVSLQASHVNGSIGSTGAGAAHGHTVTNGSNLPPYLALNWIIKT